MLSFSTSLFSLWQQAKWTTQDIHVLYLLMEDPEGSRAGWDILFNPCSMSASGSALLTGRLSSIILFSTYPKVVASRSKCNITLDWLVKWHRNFSFMIAAPVLPFTKTFPPGVIQFPSVLSISYSLSGCVFVCSMSPWHWNGTVKETDKGGGM